MSTDGTRRPNIVMILTDDHAAHSISAYGSIVNRTPRIDEIAEHGWRFDNCFVTNSLCSAARHHDPSWSPPTGRCSLRSAACCPAHVGPASSSGRRRCCAGIDA